MSAEFVQKYQIQKGNCPMYGKPLDAIGFLSQYDPALAAMMQGELERQEYGLVLIAS